MLENLQSYTISKRVYFLILTAITLGGICTRNIVIYYKKREYFRKLCKRKQKQKMSLKGGLSMKVNFNSPTLEKSVNEICSMNMLELVEFLKMDKNNYKVVFNYFQMKALHVDQRLNCVVEFVTIDESDVNLDGPLAGLPISIKDNIKIKGYENYVGCSYFLNRCKPSENSVLLTALQALGAIPFVKTNVPQTMCTIGSSNPVDGITKNPQSIRFQSGGSSSGEAALIGGCGSVLGFGSDIGGSIRIPAAFCGIVGFKPTHGRLSTENVFSTGVLSLVKSVLGPLTRDVESAVCVMRHLVNSDVMSNLDPSIPHLRFNETAYNKKSLKIGYFCYDGSHLVMPAMERAVMITVQKLKAQGHEVVAWKPPLVGEEWLSMYVRSVSVDGGRCLDQLLLHDRIDPAIANGIVHLDSGWTEWLLNTIRYRLLPSWLCSSKEDYGRFYRDSTTSLSGPACVALQAEVASLRTSLLSEWKQAGLDCVLCPAGGFTALPGGFTGVPTQASAASQWLHYMPLIASILLWNLVNCPAGTVPVTKVTEGDLARMRNDPVYQTHSVTRSMVKAQQDTLGLSVSVQCVGLPWNEELCLNLMQQVQQGASVNTSITS